VHIAQDEEEASLMLVSTTLIHPTVISSNAEVKIHEEKVFTHLDEEKERDAGTWVQDTEVTNYMSGCRTVFTNIDTAVPGTVCFGDDSVVQIEGRETVMFVCKNGESRSFDGVYFIPRLTTNIVSVSQLDDIGYKINIDTDMMKIWELGGVLLAKVKWEACLTVRGRGDEVVWRWHERFEHVNITAL
jgi:hypothetical protein